MWLMQVRWGCISELRKSVCVSMTGLLCTALLVLSSLCSMLYVLCMCMCCARREREKRIEWARRMKARVKGYIICHSNCVLSHGLSESLQRREGERTKKQTKGVYKDRWVLSLATCSLLQAINQKQKWSSFFSWQTHTSNCFSFHL